MDTFHKGPDSIISPGPVLVDLLDMAVTDGELLEVIGGEILRYPTGVGFDIRPAEGLVEMDTADMPTQRPMCIQHTVDVGRAFRLCLQAWVSIHQVPGIQEDALFRIAHQFQKVCGLLRVSHGEK